MKRILILVAVLLVSGNILSAQIDKTHPVKLNKKPVSLTVAKKTVVAKDDQPVVTKVRTKKLVFPKAVYSNEVKRKR